MGSEEPIVPSGPRRSQPPAVTRRQDRAAPMGEVAAVPGVEYVAAAGHRATRGRRPPDASASPASWRGEAGLPFAPQPAEPVEPRPRRPELRAGGIGQRLERGAGIGSDRHIERAVQAELLPVHVDLDELRAVREQPRRRPCASR